MVGVERTEIDKAVPTGSTRRERIIGVNQERKKTQMPILKNTPSKEREVDLAKKEINRLGITRKNSETMKAQTETEFSNSRNRVQDLTLPIKKSKANAMSNRLELQGTNNNTELEFGFNRVNDQYMEVLGELQTVKQELSKLQLDMASVLEEKREAKKRIEDSISKVKSGLSFVELARKEIEELNEERGLVELATIEAIKEIEETEARREVEYAQFSTTMEKNGKQTMYLNRQVRYTKDLESKLAVMNSDLEVLQNELKLVKGMERENSEIKLGNSPEKLSSLMEEISKTREEESATSSLLQSAMVELKAAKKELQRIKEEGFQFMAAMDVIRNELKYVSEERKMLKKLEEKEESTAQDLNLKKRRAKSKLEAATKAEGKAKAILGDLSTTLHQLEKEKEAAVREKEAIEEENMSLKLEIKKKESDSYLAEERLQDAFQELEVAKKRETAALKNLTTLTENTMKARASSFLHSSTITMSSFEYEYLSQRAEGVDEIANKKVAASQAWIEAIRAREKEILMKTELYQREIRELRMVEKNELHAKEKSLTAKKAVEGEPSEWVQQEKGQDETENLQLEVAMPRKPMKENSISSSSKPTKTVRRPPSPGSRYPARSPARSPAIILKKKKKIMPNLGKLFNKRSDNKAWKQEGKGYSMVY